MASTDEQALSDELDKLEDEDKRAEEARGSSEPPPKPKDTKPPEPEPDLEAVAPSPPKKRRRRTTRASAKPKASVFEVQGKIKDATMMTATGLCLVTPIGRSSLSQPALVQALETRADNFAGSVAQVCSDNPRALYWIERLTEMGAWGAVAANGAAFVMLSATMAGFPLVPGGLAARFLPELQPFLQTPAPQNGPPPPPPTPEEAFGAVPTPPSGGVTPEG